MHSWLFPIFCKPLKAQTPKCAPLRLTRSDKSIRKHCRKPACNEPSQSRPIWGFIAASEAPNLEKLSLALGLLVFGHGLREVGLQVLDAPPVGRVSGGELQWLRSSRALHAFPE